MAVSFFVAAVVLFFALTLTMLPAKDSTLYCLRRALFAKSGKKYQKTPFETNGFKTSFARITLSKSSIPTARCVSVT